MSDAPSRPAAVVLIAALARNGTIGRDNALPWRLPADLRRFRALTTGRPVIMGRRTFESIGRALPGRENLVVSRRAGLALAGCAVLGSLDAAFAACAGREAMVIGGAQVYAQAMPFATHMRLTVVDADVEGDAFFPRFDPAQWQLTFEEAHEDTSAGLAFAFRDYVRRGLTDLPRASPGR